MGKTVIGHDELFGVVQAYADQDCEIVSFNMEAGSEEVWGPNPEYKYYEPTGLITMIVQYRIKKDGKP